MTLENLQLTWKVEMSSIVNHVLLGLEYFCSKNIIQKYHSFIIIHFYLIFF